MNYKYTWNDKRQNRVISSELFTSHAIKNIKGRLSGLVTIQDVEDKINQYRPELSNMHDNEQVMIVIRQLGQTMSRNGSNGNLVVACVDPRTVTVKTVMLRHSRQLGQKLSA